MVSRSTLRLLRIPFSFFLSPIYFFGLSQVPDIDTARAILVFFIIHFLVYPASNAYNSYMDRDRGSIGGLEHPPAPENDLFVTTVVLDIAGIFLSLLVSPLFALVMLFYIGASKAYSYRRIRLKKYPVIGYLVVIIFQGAVTFWLVYHGSSASGAVDAPPLAMTACALLIGGFYPLTQIYQHRQDLEDGVRSLSYLLGYKGTFEFCGAVYAAAWIFMAQFFIRQSEVDKLIFVSICFVPVIVYFISWFLQVRKNAAAADFRNTMRMNWLAASCTNVAFVTLLIWKLFE
ncbi:MAG TPA: UbiA family prenyltransferase [Chitinophagaceae bacterium]|nr:UbiA family prenyltransferase [Chitinophagaceae bacterium]